MSAKGIGAGPGPGPGLGFMLLIPGQVVCVLFVFGVSSGLAPQRCVSVDSLGFEV